MINILIVSGSPVEGASTDIILTKLSEEIIKRLKLPNEIKFFKLNRLNFIPCQACGEAPEQGWCLYGDALTVVLDSVERCDCLLLGSPVYFDTVSAQTKMFIDRCNCFRPPDFKNENAKFAFLKRLNRKAIGAIILVGGERGWFEGARRVIAGFFKWVEIENQGTLIYRSKDFRKTGEAGDDERLKEKIMQLANHLAGVLNGKT